MSLLSGPANRRESQVVAGILKRNLNIEVEVVTKDGPVVLEDYLSHEGRRVAAIVAVKGACWAHAGRSPPLASSPPSRSLSEAEAPL